MKKYILGIIGLILFSTSCKKEANNTYIIEDKPFAKTLESKKVKMILDLDTGIDDAMALALALSDPNIELIGVVTVFGNVSRDTSIENTLALLDILGHSEIPVYGGATTQLGQKDVYQPNDAGKLIHGTNGLGNVIIPKSKRTVEKQDGVDFMIESAKKHGKDLYIVATGPLTNMAAVIQKDPTFGQQVGKIVIMGGALIVEGNMNHFAEANIYNDPLAANAFYTSTTPFTMVGLEVTQRTKLTKKDTQKWRELNTPASKSYADIVDYYIDSLNSANKKMV